MKQHSDSSTNDILSDTVKLYETVTGQSAEGVSSSYIMGFVDCYHNYSGDYKAGYKQAILDSKTLCARPQGKWIYEEGWNAYCSNCSVPTKCETNFCPYCGADMKGDNNG